MTSSTPTADSSPSFWRHLAGWADRMRLARKLAILLTIVAVGAGFATYAALTDNPPLGHDPERVYLLLNLDIVILLLLGAVVARKIVSIWVKRRRGQAGSRMHVRLVALFSVVAVAPAIVVATFSALFFHISVQSWFSERVSTAINESLSLAEAYQSVYRLSLLPDLLAIANDINRDAPRLMSAGGDEFDRYVTRQAAQHGLTEVLVFDSTGRTIARSNLTLALQFEPVAETDLPKSAGEVVAMSNYAGDRVRAVIKLDRLIDTYLVIGRLVEPEVLEHAERVRAAVAEYQQLEGRRSSLQVTFTLIYVVVALLLLMVTVWIGLMLADGLVRPISRLIGAADRVRAGDLTARVPTAGSNDEVGNLARAFNRMTSQLEGQRRDLIEANRQLDLRRRFTETVLAGVSAGVLGLDHDGRINLPNKSATELLGMEVDELIGRELVDAVPALAELMAEVGRRPARLIEGQVKIKRGAEVRTLLVRIAAERLDGAVSGYVVTFDDVTELLGAQRKAAWADVARRIAHEIKNPLTPIQLSAERLKRRYLKEIKSDPEVFVACTDTIVRQVGDIGRMVDEFSAFARMPTPVIKPHDVFQLCRQAVFLQKQAHPTVEFELTGPDEPPLIPCDDRQIAQALTNLLQNALDAVEGRPAPADGVLPPGHIRVALSVGHSEAVITVEDNGKGLPTEDRERLTEPYVTTRTKGTGLGLAIVKKIMEDHGGRLVLQDRSGGGARVLLVLPRAEAIRPPAEIDAEAGEPPRRARLSHGA